MERFEGVEDSLCVGQQTSEGETVVLFIKMANGFRYVGKSVKIRHFHRYLYLFSKTLLLQKHCVTAVLVVFAVLARIW